jgi:hypothetical protein
MAMHLTTFSPKCCCDPSVMSFQVASAWRPYRNLERQRLAAIFGGQGVENGGELLRVEFDCIPSSAPSVLMRLAMHPRWEKFFAEGRHEPSTTAPVSVSRADNTTDNPHTDDLVDLAIFCSVGRRKARAERRGEALLDGLEGAADSRRPAGGAESRPLE